MEHRGADALGLVQPDDALHERVVIGIPDRPDGGLHPLQGEVLREPDGGVLLRLNRSSQRLSVLQLAVAVRALLQECASPESCVAAR